MKNTVLTTVMLVVLLTVSCAMAATLNGDPSAYNDGVTTWSGNAEFYYSSVDGTLDVDVEYAVYGPGNYPGGVSQPSGEYTYAYQIFTNPGSTQVSSLAVEILPGAPHDGITHDSAYSVILGVAPSAEAFTSSSAVWHFLFDNIEAGERSVILLFFSPAPPNYRLGDGP